MGEQYDYIIHRWSYKHTINTYRYDSYPDSLNTAAGTNMLCSRALSLSPSVSLGLSPSMIYVCQATGGFSNCQHSGRVSTHTLA